jgi:hypothetical protein
MSKGYRGTVSVLAVLGGSFFGAMAYVGSRLLYEVFGAKELDRAPEGYVWVSSGGKYPEMEPTFLCILAVCLLVSWLLATKSVVTPLGRRIGRPLEMFGCLGVIIGVAVGVLIWVVLAKATMQ